MKTNNNYSLTIGVDSLDILSSAIGLGLFTANNHRNLKFAVYQ
jgi:hypothetical protein